MPFNKKTHILLVFHHFRTPRDIGGLRSWHIGRTLSLKGFKVSAVIPGIDPLTGEKRPHLNSHLFVRDFIDGVDIKWSASIKNDRTSKFKRILYYLSASISQAILISSFREIDLIITTSMPLPMMAYSFFISKIKKIPIVVDVRDLSIDTAIELKYLKKSPLIRIFQLIENFIFKNADLLIPISGGLEKVLRRKGVSKEKVITIPMGYEKNIYEEMVDKSRDIKAELSIDDKFMVLYTGTMGFAVDIPTLLEASELTREFNDIIYVFVGHGQNFQKYRKIAENKNLNCIFLGARPKMEIPLFCKQADICVYPLKGQDLMGSFFGNKVFDYIGSGTPMIFSGPRGDIKDLLAKCGGGIYINSGDNRAVADAILSLWRDRDKGTKLGKNGKRFIEKNYTVDIMMNEFHKAVAEIIES